MKLGFFGGCFNPPTIAHYNLIKQALLDYNFDDIYFVPVNDFYSKKSLINMQDRINMLELIVKNDEHLHVSNIENEYNKSFTAIEIFEILKEKYKKDDIFFLMGEDNFINMKKWKDYNKLIKYSYIVFQRNLNIELKVEDENIIYMKNNQNLNISSSIVRDKVKQCQNIDGLVSDDVKKYIIKNNLYI